MTTAALFATNIPPKDMASQKEGSLPKVNGGLPAKKKATLNRKWVDDRPLCVGNNGTLDVNIHRPSPEIRTVYRVVVQKHFVKLLDRMTNPKTRGISSHGACVLDRAMVRVW